MTIIHFYMHLLMLTISLFFHFTSLMSLFGMSRLSLNPNLSPVMSLSKTLLYCSFCCQTGLWYKRLYPVSVFRSQCVVDLGGYSIVYRFQLFKCTNVHAGSMQQHYFPIRACQLCCSTRNITGQISADFHTSSSLVR